MGEKRFICIENITILTHFRIWHQNENWNLPLEKHKCCELDYRKINVNFYGYLAGFRKTYHGLLGLFCLSIKQINVEKIAFRKFFFFLIQSINRWKLFINWNLDMNWTDMAE